MNNLKIYLKSILIPVILGGIVGFVIYKNIGYDNLVKPNFAPPGNIFPIIWTILYILMGTSYGILESNQLIDKKIDVLYYTQLIVNMLWPVFFFTFELRLIAFIIIIILTILIVVMIVEFYKKNKIAGLLQIPYLIWVVFAGFLNIGIYLLNK